MNTTLPHNPPNMCTKCGGYTTKAPKWTCHKCECQTTQPESGLSDYEIKLEKIVELIRFCNTTIEGIVILKNFLNSKEFEIKEEIKAKCERCGCEYTLTGYGDDAGMCINPVSYRTSGICGGKLIFVKEQNVIEICEHPQDQVRGYHDSSLLCHKCNCIIEQYGKKIEPPTPLF